MFWLEEGGVVYLFRVLFYVLLFVSVLYSSAEWNSNEIVLNSHDFEPQCLSLFVCLYVKLLLLLGLFIYLFIVTLLASTMLFEI